MKPLLVLLLVGVCLLAVVCKFCIAVEKSWAGEDMLVLVLDIMCTVILVGFSLYLTFS